MRGGRGAREAPGGGGREGRRGPPGGAGPAEGALLGGLPHRAEGEQGGRTECEQWGEVLGGMRGVLLLV